MFAITQQAKAAQTFEDVIAAIDNGAGATRSWAGATVNPNTAMQQATVYACIRILSETIATLPIKVQTKNVGGLWVDSDHDVLAVLDTPNDFQTQHDLISMWVAWMELSGNAYSYKLYSGSEGKKKIHTLLPLESPGVSAELTSDWKMKYQVSGVFNGSFGKDKILHMRHFGTAGHIGLNPIQKMRHDIGLAQRGKEHASGVFARGAVGSQWIKAEGLKNVDQAREMQEGFDKLYGGGASQAGKTKVMWGGASLEESGMSAVDVQLLQLLKLEKEEIASIFGVPGFLINSAEKNTTWGTGLEEITKSFMRFSLRPRISRVCQTMKHELLGRNERKRTRFVFETEAFTLGSFKEVVDAANIAIAAGMLNPNEGRDLINMNPRDGGEVYRESPNSVPEGSGNDDETTPEPPEDDDENEENDDE